MPQGTLAKMAAEAGDPVAYTLRLGEEHVPLNPLIGTTLRLHFAGEIRCTSCGRKTKKSFSQGHCFPCSQRLAACDMCIVRPERCHYAAGTCREPEWGEAHCMRDHVVYLANTSGLKVGVTRATQVPTRWIDQGAVEALPILAAATRHVAGLAEVALAEHVADKTNWRALLKGSPEPLDLPGEAARLLELAAPALDAVRAEHGDGALRVAENARVTHLGYPVESYPEKIKSHNFDKTPGVEGVLRGIKGQYLLLDSGVLNVRKFTAYDVAVDW